MLIYRAPVAFGEGIAAFPDGMPKGWSRADRRMLGNDTLEILEPPR
jgi:dihydrofolate reductase